MKFRKHFDYDVEAASNETAVSFSGTESLTLQSMAEDADINVLMTRFGLTGRMPDNPRVPVFGDFTGITDYQGALNAVMQASDSFNELPASVRARFRNNPQELLEFCADDGNIEEARSLGLLKEDLNEPGQTGSGSRSRAKRSAPSRSSEDVSGGDGAATGGGEPDGGAGAGAGASAARKAR